jgi:hypothetical protein
VRISQTDDLSGVAWVGENFLIAGEAGIENDFATAARDGARGTSVKYAPVFQSESGGSVLNFGQFVLQEWSSKFTEYDDCRSFVGAGFGRRKRAEMIDRPIGEHGAAINKFAGDGTKDARVVGADAMIAHDEVAVPGDPHGAVVAHVFVLRGHVRLVNGAAVDVNDALTNLDIFAGQADDAFDERFRMVERIPENDNVASLDGLEAIDKFVDEDALLVREQRGHAGALDLNRLIEEDNDDERKADGDEKVARPNTDLVSQGMGSRRRRS